MRSEPSEDIGIKINAALGTELETPVSVCAVGGSKLSPTLIKTKVVVSGKKALFLGPGYYAQSATILLSGNGPQVSGNHAGNTILDMQSNRGINITIADTTDNYLVENLALTRYAGSAAPNDIGLHAGSYNWHGMIRNLAISNQYDGLYLLNTDYSALQHIVVDYSARHGILMTNPKVLQNLPVGALQYYVSDVLVQLSNSHGIVVSADGGAAPVGNWEGVRTFANGGNGLRVLGNVAALRVTNSFFGTDSQNGVNDPGVAILGGTGHVFTNTYFELSGINYKTGSPVNSATHGVYLSSAVDLVTMNNVTLSANAGSGLYTDARTLVISNSAFKDNGLRVTSATPSPFNSGLVVGGYSKAYVNGCYFQNSGTQLKGTLGANILFDTTVGQ